MTQNKPFDFRVRFHALLFVILNLCILDVIHAQNHRSEAWMGYINSVNIKNRWYFWNDYHFVPESFALYRLGMTYETEGGYRITSGYAQVWTASPNTTALTRTEHRYWGQIIKNFTWGERIRHNARFRYDLRFREPIDPNGDVVKRTYLLNYRWRVSNNVRFKITNPTQGKFFHVDVMNETLYNTGKHLNNGIDQIRNYLLFGYTTPKITLLSGYSNRFFPSLQGPWRMNHGVTFWFAHRFAWKRFRTDEDIL